MHNIVVKSPLYSSADISYSAWNNKDEMQEMHLHEWKITTGVQSGSIAQVFICPVEH